VSGATETTAGLGTPCSALARVLRFVESWGQTRGLAPVGGDASPRASSRYAAFFPDGDSGAAPTAAGSGAAPVRFARSG